MKLDLSDIIGIKSLKAGETVYLSGTVYTARDAAHKRICFMLDREEKLPFDLKGASVYYAGPTQAKTHIVGSMGPTTSCRMDGFAPRLYDLGLLCTIGKGQRSDKVRETIKRNGGVYFCAIGGAGALYAEKIKQCSVIAFEDLGCESIKKLYVEDFPVVVGIDSSGGSIFNSGI